MSVYSQLHGAGCQIDNHESDLYVLDSPLAREIVKANGMTYSTFRSNTDGCMWMELPFMFAPWWEGKK